VSAPLLRTADAVRRGAGLLERPTLACVRVLGADRLDYLHRMLTQALRTLAAGQARHACFLDVRGRILAEVWVWSLADEARLEFEEESRDALVPALERYVIADDVRFVPIEEFRAVSLLGERSEECLRRAGVEAPPPLAFVETEVGGRPARVLRRDLGDVAAFEVRLAAADLAAVLAALEGAGAKRASADAWDALRVEQGVPRAGRELTRDVLFNEAGLEDAIAWGKGCFPGQEPVVMARHRGRPPRLLVRLALEGARTAAPGARLLRQGSAVGVLTSLAPGGAALGFVRHADAQDGAPFDVEGGGLARPLR
jgi:folate-binding protein YgfZ